MCVATALLLVASLHSVHGRSHPAIAVLRLPLAASVAPGIVGPVPVIAPIVPAALALASAPTFIVAAPLVMPPVMMRPLLALIGPL